MGYAVRNLQLIYDADLRLRTQLHVAHGLAYLHSYGVVHGALSTDALRISKGTADWLRPLILKSNGGG